MSSNIQETYTRTIDLLRAQKDSLIQDRATIDLQLTKLDTAIAVILDLAGPQDWTSAIPVQAPNATPIKPSEPPQMKAAEKTPEPAPENTPEPVTEDAIPHDELPVKALIARAAVEIIKEANRPLVGSEVLELMRKSRHPALMRLPAGKEINRVGSYLSLAKDALLNIPGRGYWPRGMEMPPEEVTATP